MRPSWVKCQLELFVLPGHAEEVVRRLPLTVPHDVHVAAELQAERLVERAAGGRRRGSGTWCAGSGSAWTASLVGSSRSSSMKPKRTPSIPFAVAAVRLALDALPHEAGALGVAHRPLVEPVDLELEPVVANSSDQVPLEEPRRLVGEETAPEIRMDRQPAEPRDSAAFVRTEKPIRRPARRRARRRSARSRRLGVRSLDLREELSRVVAGGPRGTGRRRRASSAQRGSRDRRPARRIVTLTDGRARRPHVPAPASAAPNRGDAAQDQPEADEHPAGDHLVEEERAVDQRVTGIRYVTNPPEEPRSRRAAS